MIMFFHPIFSLLSVSSGYFQPAMLLAWSHYKWFQLTKIAENLIQQKGIFCFLRWWREFTYCVSDGC